MSEKVLGRCACPLCGFPDQEVRLSKNEKPYMACDECGMQLFSRQAKSVNLLKSRVKQIEPVKVAPVVKAEPVAPVKPPAVPPVAVKKTVQDDEEVTMFDVLFGKKSAT